MKALLLQLCFSCPAKVMGPYQPSDPQAFRPNLLFGLSSSQHVDMLLSPCDLWSHPRVGSSRVLEGREVWGFILRFALRVTPPMQSFKAANGKHKRTFPRAIQIHRPEVLMPQKKWKPASVLRSGRGGRGHPGTSPKMH